MSLLHSSSIGDVTRGGQLLIHFFRMLGQVLSKFAERAAADPAADIRGAVLQPHRARITATLPCSTRWRR